MARHLLDPDQTLPVQRGIREAVRVYLRRLGTLIAIGIIVTTGFLAIALIMRGSLQMSVIALLPAFISLAFAIRAIGIRGRDSDRTPSATAGFVEKLISPMSAYLLITSAIELALYVTINAYGPTSEQYSFLFFLTDLVRVFATFLLIGYFFRRWSCQIRGSREIWTYFRSLLLFFIALVCSVSLFSLPSGGRSFNSLAVEISKNLYFACLVLITFLYLILTKSEWTAAKEELSLQVSALAIYLAAPAGTLALSYLASGNESSHAPWLLGFRNMLTSQ